MSSHSPSIADLDMDIKIETDPGLLQSLAIQGVVPACVVSPRTPEEIALLLALAADRGWVVATSGGHTRQNAGGIPQRVDILLRTHRLNAIEHYDPGDLTIGAGAGMTLSALQATLAKHNQYLPLNPANPGQSTLGGILASAAQGPLLAGFGGVREFCIGVKFVTAAGKQAKGGGRVVKNVAGYDLMKLMIGSYGTLGVLVSASFKAFPRPRQTRTYMATFESSQKVMKYRNWLMQSGLAWLCFEAISPAAREYLCSPPEVREVEEFDPPGDFSARRSSWDAPSALAPETSASPLPGSAPAPVSLDSGFPSSSPRPFAATTTASASSFVSASGMKQEKTWKVLLKVAGSDAIFKRYDHELSREVEHLEGEAESEMWQWIENFENAVIARHQNAMIIEVSVPLTAVGRTFAAAENSALHHNFFAASIGRLTEGRLICAMVPLAVDPPAAMQYAAAVSELRSLLPPESSARVIYCPKEAKIHFDIWGAPVTDMEAMKAVKQALDPKNILNRGRFLI